MIASPQPTLQQNTSDVSAMNGAITAAPHGSERCSSYAARWRAAQRLAEAFAPPDVSGVDIAALLSLKREEVYGGLIGVNPALLEPGSNAYVAPYLRRAALGLGKVVQASQSAPLGFAAAMSAVLPAFAERARAAAEQTFTLLMNAAWIRGETSGSDLAARTFEFGALLLQPEYRSRCQQRFPVLDELLFAMTEDAVASWGEFADRLIDDADALRALLPDGLGEILALRFYAGDPHNGGRSVVIVEGTGGKIVYKPRPLDTDAALARAVAWLDGRLKIGLRHYPVLNRTAYGWTPFVESGDCADAKQVELCYERCGALLGLLFVLGGADIHNENIICSGPEPYIIDGEALFSGPLSAPSLEGRRKQAARIETVLNICYLPCIMAIGSNYVDVSAAGYSAGQQVELKRIVKDGDNLVAGQLTISLPESGNRPTLGGVPQAAADNLPAFEHGFRRAMEAFIAHREEFERSRDLMPSFAKVSSRFIPRATSQYSQISRNALHPHACVSRGAHDSALSVLALHGGWPERVARQVLAADLVAIRRGDVPFFHGRADSRSLWTSSGHEIPGVFQISGHEAMRRRLRRLSPRTIDAQLQSIRLSFAAAAGTNETARRPDIRVAAPDEPDLRLGTARAIGDCLLGSAIEAGQHLYWAGRALMGERFTAQIVGAELYGGVAGIGVFLAELSRRTGDGSYRDAALRCLQTVRDVNIGARLQIGAFDGNCGMIYADLLMSRALGIPGWSKTAEIVGQVSKMIEHDRYYDITSGSAGALLVALRLREATGLAAAEQLAHRCARHLIEHASPADSALGWRSAAFEEPLTGMAHGSCGIAMALGEYAAAFDDEAAWDHCFRAFDFAKASFDEEARTWRDLRHEKGHMIAWCHGAAGMTLARQRIAELAPDRADRLRIDIDVGLQALVEQPGPGSDTLCHGRSGNWEPLWCGDPEHRALAEAEVTRFCQDWRAGVTPAGDLAHPTPDLMNGLAGIGLQLLRSVDATTPRVATLGL